MIKAKEILVRNVALFLVFSFAISASYFVSKAHYSAKSVPVFMGEEVVVKKAAVNTISVVKPVTVAKAKTASIPVKVEMIPVPNSPVPLPIIPPTITNRVLPIYPSSALEKGMIGEMVLSAYVGLNGAPEKIETKTSSGIQALDEAAIKAVSQWKFSPATQAGAALASWYEVPVKFELN